jgi:biotin transport system substrate-specific component
MAAGNIVCYILGLIWFLFLTHTGIWAALTACVLPFLIGDALKIIAAAFLSVRCLRVIR